MKEFVLQGSGHGHLGIQIDSGVTHLGQFVPERSGADPQLLRSPIATPTLFPECLNNDTEFLLPQIITQRSGPIGVFIGRSLRLLLCGNRAAQGVLRRPRKG